MYGLVRTVHLYAGLVLAAGLLMYGVTGFVIAHGDWFPGGEPVLTERRLTSDVAVRMNDEHDAESAIPWQLAAADELGLRGRPGKRQPHDDGSWTFEYGRPGTVERLRLHPGSAEVALVEESTNLARLLNRLHHFHGYAGGGRFFLWGLFVDLASLAMILFPLTGIYLWWTLKRDHRLGALILGGSTAYTVGSLCWLLWGP